MIMVSHNGDLLLEETDYTLDGEDVRFAFECRGPRGGKSGDIVQIVDTDTNAKVEFEVLRTVPKWTPIPQDCRSELIRRGPPIMRS